MHREMSYQNATFEIRENRYAGCCTLYVLRYESDICIEFLPGEKEIEKERKRERRRALPLM